VNDHVRPTSILAAAIQLEPRLADTEENLRRAASLTDEAGRAGARLIVLPEFFTTGMAFAWPLVTAALPLHGPATVLMGRAARAHGAMVGGSFLCRHPDGRVRNTFVLMGPDGMLGAHDKDLPTMWESYFYEGGSDRGVIGSDPRFGVAMCWEFLRRPTAERLRGRVDCVIGGSAWWSVPSWRPGVVFRPQQALNASNATQSVCALARMVGAPIVHGALVGEVQCRLPGTPLPYRGRYEGGALICDRNGSVLAQLTADEGPGYTIAEVPLGAGPASEALPATYWLRPRGWIPAAAWHYQGSLGRRWRRRRAVDV
jgi:predicted amidohydrolase